MPIALESARRASEILLALAVLQHALEHAVTVPRDRTWAVAQVPLAVALALGWWPALVQGGLLAISVFVIQHLQGPYNGGSDRMRLLTLTCLWASHLVAPMSSALADVTGTGAVLPAAAAGSWARLALGYLAVQVVLSYTLAGYVKLTNRDWRSGQALVDVFAFSMYPVSDSLRGWARRPRLLWLLAWGAMAFEILFPVAFLDARLLPFALAGALGFHVVNSMVFGLNRFVWSWLATYPILLWFQTEVAAILG